MSFRSVIQHHDTILLIPRYSTVAVLVSHTIHTSLSPTPSSQQDLELSPSHPKISPFLPSNLGNILVILLAASAFFLLLPPASDLGNLVSSHSHSLLSPVVFTKLNLNVMQRMRKAVFGGQRKSQNATRKSNPDEG